MALTIPCQISGTVAFPLNNRAQPAIQQQACGSCRLVLRAKTIKFNNMKFFFTLALGLMLTVAMFAADRRPVVTVSAPRKFEIVIDGQRYLSYYGNSISISNMFNGRHSIKVYELRPGFFMKSKTLVASSGFQLRNRDLQINVDRFGHLQISESRFGRDWNDRDYGRNDRDYGNDRDNRLGRDRDGRF